MRPLAILAASAMLLAGLTGLASSAASADTPKTTTLITNDTGALVPPYSGYVFIDKTVDVDYVSGSALLSSSPDGTGHIIVDDEMAIEATHPDGTTTAFDHDFSNGCSPLSWADPIDISSILMPGTNHLHFRMMDRCGTSMSSSTMYFVTDTPTSPAPVVTNVTIAAPSPMDDYGTRGITITPGQSSTAISSYDYGWARDANATAPTTTPQHSSSTVGRLNYLDTNPNEDWYLMVRAVGTAGGSGPWSSPLKVHTPQPGLFIVTGDSVNSGHHQDQDKPHCLSLADLQKLTKSERSKIKAFTDVCNVEGQPRLIPNDQSYAWGGKAVSWINLTLPERWGMTSVMLAQSGTQTTSLGKPNTLSGTDAWAKGTSSQVGQMRARLASQADSWNVVAESGGADDAGFADALAGYYQNNYVQASPLPWAVSKRKDCPDSQGVWDRFQRKSASVSSNLQGLVDVAQRTSQGTRVVDVEYSYTVDTSNICSSDHAKWHGQKAVVDAINAVHESLHGLGITHIRASSSFGDQPVHDGMLQLTRLYGYPHPSQAGQSQIAFDAATALSVP